MYGFDLSKKCVGNTYQISDWECLPQWGRDIPPYKDTEFRKPWRILSRFYLLIYFSFLLLFLKMQFVIRGFNKSVWISIQTCIPWIPIWIFEIWISKILNFDFLKNEGSFWSEIKYIFPSSTQALTFTFIVKKQTSKNVVDTTFKRFSLSFLQ